MAGVISRRSAILTAVKTRGIRAEQDSGVITRTAAAILAAVLAFGIGIAAYARGHGGGGHAGHFSGGGHFGGGHFHSHVFIGGAFYGPAYWPPYYPYFDYPYYPPAVVEPPLEYIQPAPVQPFIYYYCPGSQAYYPYVRQCPGGWQQVPAQPPS